ncbi:MAG: GAF domain-containing protein [bacterium]
MTDTLKARDVDVARVSRVYERSVSSRVKIERMIVVLRWLLIVFLVVGGQMMRDREGGLPFYLSVVGIAIYNALVGYALWRVKDPTPLGYVSGALDIIFVSLICLFSGGTHSIFLPVLYLVLMVLAFRFKVAVGALFALLCSLLYISIAYIGGDMRSLKLTWDGLRNIDFIVVNIGLFFLVSVFGGRISAERESHASRREKIERALSESNKLLKEKNAELEDFNRKLLETHEISRKIWKARDYRTLVESILPGISRILSFDRVLLYLMDEGGNIEFIKGVGYPKPAHSIPQRILRRMAPVIERELLAETLFKEGKPYVIVRDILKYEGCDRSRAAIFRTRELAIVPLKSDGKCIGAMEVDNYRGKAAVLDKNVRILSILADFIGGAIGSLRGEEKGGTHEYERGGDKSPVG